MDSVRWNNGFLERASGVKAGFASPRALVRVFAGVTFRHVTVDS